MGTFTGKNAYVGGLTNDASLCWKPILEMLEGDVKHVIISVFDSAGMLARNQALIGTLPEQYQERVTLIRLNVAKKEQIDALADVVREILPEGEGIDAVLHSIAMLPGGFGQDDLFLDASWDQVGTGYLVSAFSYKELLRGLLPVLNRNASAVALSFNSQKPMAGYGWMGIIKGGLESITQHLAGIFGRKLNMQVNCVSAAVYPSKAARNIPDYDYLEAAYQGLPLEGGVDKLGRTIATLLSGNMPMVTGQTIYADSGYQHAMGIDPRIVEKDDEFTLAQAA